MTHRAHTVTPSGSLFNENLLCENMAVPFGVLRLAAGGGVAIDDHGHMPVAFL